jgi:crossover junction endodeoxyribonuclease RuvC
MAYVYVGVDPGMHGGFAFFEDDKMSVYDVPLMKNKNDKKDYDIKEMAKILKLYKGKEVVFCIEAVFSRPGEGVSSSFNFGRGKGIWEGLAHGLDFNVIYVSPQTWKKDFSLIHSFTKEEKEKNKELPQKIFAKLKRDIKKEYKEKARKLAGEMHPKIKDEFKKVNSDGKAEAVLIANWAKNNYKQ